ncbi:MAG: DNA polymerase III subunit alpha [Lachnospiraceae bacterium]|jgi:DNA polymerase-3 subunit alpha|nr:DNA polymerase III subunit alpha [Lachnospiraceae bacterium]
MDFTHLHVHTEYSLLDGSNKIEEYVSRVKELGMDSAAITDHGAMYGCIDFYKAAKAAGIRPILGCEVYVAPGSRFDRDVGDQEDKYYHLVLLAENNTGYANLMKVVSRGFVEGFYYKPRVDMELLEEYHEGLIALSACLAGEVPRYLVRGMYEDAKAAALRHEKIFGKGNYFLELQDHGISEQQLVNQQLMRLHQETGIDLVATNDVHYTYAEDATAHDILLCIQTAKKLEDEDRMRYEGGQYYVKSPEEMARLFPYALEALENTHKIAMRCNVEIEFGVTKLPKFDVPEGYTSWEYLNKLCKEGLERSYQPVTPELKERLRYELDTIANMGYVDYFLIVWDFIRYARDHDIMVGPGRGSAAGSLVSYTLGITQLDPIKYSLLFERFLNPERVSMPDIDIDFCFERRQEVIDYVVEKYGKDRVVQIVTFGTMAARNVLRDVGRVLGMPYSQVDAVAKMIPVEQNKPLTIEQALKRNPEFSRIYEDDPEIRNLVDMAKRLEGLPRHTSMHAAGVVISQKEVDEYVPLSKASDGSITTQFTMTTLEELGLLKMDFLGLRTLTVIQDTVRLVEKNTGVFLDMDRIDYNDAQVLASIGTGKTEGVFQLESAGMKNFMKELKPQSLEDIIAGVALYRPGPMDFIPQYIRGKNNAAMVTYDCPQLRPILESTYGCIVYQEQVMQIVRDLGGYTMGRSDLLRRAMSKKKISVMEKERQNFVYGNEDEGIPGCIKKGIDEKTAHRIYDEMIDFAKYAFNKSHAAAYAVVAYQTAYLKYYYPVQYMAALMTSVIDFPTKVSGYILHCRQIGIDILPPDINRGDSRFSVDGNGIRYGLSAIKSVGRSVIDDIVKERELGGPYTTLNNFLSRMSGKEVNKRVVENLIRSGAMDCLEGNRKQKLLVYQRVMDSVQQEKKNSMAGQLSLLDIVGEEEKKDYVIQLPPVEEYEKEALLAFEKEVLGIYISGHPLEKYTQMLARNATAVTTDFLPDEDTGLPRLADGSKVTVGGMITNRTIKYTKTNQVMAFITVEDLVGTVEVIVFPKTYERSVSVLEEENKVFVQGRVAAEDDKASKLICEKIYLFTDIPRELWIQFPSKEEYRQREGELLELIGGRERKDVVVIYLKKERAMKRLPPGQRTAIDSLDMEGLKGRFGEGNIRILEKDMGK